MHTSVHIQVIDGVSSYTVLKNLVKNAPPYGTGGAEYDYTNAIPITLHSDIIAPAGIDTTEMAVADSKKLLLNSSSSGTLRTIDAAGRGRIFNITGTVLTLNSIQLKGGSAADGKGGAVYAGTGGILALSGNTVILPSTGDDENIQGKNDVYADIDNGAAIKVDSTLAASGTVARITPAQYTEGRVVLLGTPADILAHYSKFAITPKSGGRWSVTNAGRLIEKTLTINGNTGGTWKDLKETVKAAPEGSVITIKGAVQATNTGFGTAADWGEITIDKNLTIQGGAAVSMLDANAAALGTNAHRIFYVVSGKTLTLKNLTLTGGEKTADDGGAVFVFSGSTLDMSGCAIESCKADNGGAIYAQGGSAVKLTNTTIKNCEAIGSTGKGGALYVYSSTAAMIRCTLTGNKAKSGGGIYAEKASGGRSTAVTIKGGTIGGIHTADANKADGTGPDGNGGGILIADGCTLTMQDYTDTGGSTYRAELIGNGAQHAGGGICANSNSTITLTNVYITKCTAGNSGGAVYTKGAAAELTNCTLTANTANDGGALCAKTQSGSQSSITVCGGIIGGTNSTDSNKAAGTGAEGNGGGIYIESNCTVRLKDYAAVTGNTAAGDGGGVYTTGGTVTMMDCMLTGNTAAGNGGGVYAAQNNLGGSSAAAAVTMQNAARILPSSGSDIHTKGKNDVYVGGSTMITLVGELTGTVPVARITVADDKYQPTTQVLNGSTGAGTEPNQNYTKFTVTPKDTDEWKISSQGMLVLNATVVDATASSSDAWKKLKDAVAAVFEGGSITVKGTVQATHTGSGTAAANSGEIIIDKNLTIKGEGATAMLDANGSAGGKPPHRIFDVKENKTLILENLTLKNGTGTGDEKGGGLYVRKWAKAKLSHCTIQTCTAKEGGGIAAEGGTVELDTCTLTGNTATIAGGGIYAHTNGSHVSKVIIIGSTIGGTGTGESNTSKYGGGIYVAEKSRLKMTSSAIKKCQALLEGGAIYTKGGTVELDTCTLTGNKGENTGGGLCVRANGSTGASVTIKGGSIGGTGTDEPNITGSSGKGGGIFISGTDSSVTLSDSAAVNGNKAELDGGGIYVDENSTLTVNGSSLAKNTASGKGGGVYIKDASATFTMSGNAAIIPSSGIEAYLPGKNDVHLDGGSKIKLTGDFNPQETAARITPDNYSTRAVLTGASTALNSHHSKFAVTPQNLGGGQKQTWKVADTGFLRKAALTLTINGSDSDAWTKLKTEVEKPSGGAAKIIIEGAVTANSTHKGEITVNREVEIIGNSINAVLDAANENRIFKVDTAGKLTVKNLKLTNGHTSGVSDYGSAVYAAGELTVISCEIVENHAEHAGGGGIYIKKDGKCTINGSSTRKTIIGKNKATKGGGLQTDGNCTIGEYTVIGGSGMGNQGTQFGGGIFVSRTGECMVKDGVEISYNTLSSSTTRGGGIYIERTSVSKGKLIVHGTSENPVKITNHTATYGGGIYVEADASIRDAEIKDCTATNGGGMYLDNDAQVKMENNAHITGCTTILNGEGGAIYIKRATAVFTMSGNAVITLSSGNNKNKPGKNDVYFDGGAMIHIDSTLTGTAPVARITVASNKYMDTTQVLTGSKVNTEHLKFAVTPKNGNQYWAVDKNGRLANNFNSIFNTISADVIQAAESSMSSNQINNRKALLDGRLILYKTNRGNYGIMHITDVDNTSGAGHITFNYKTFNTSGTVQKTRNGCNLEGTYSFDLDNESTDQNDKDFWLPNVSTSDESKHFEPKNGAKFYTLP